MIFQPFTEHHPLPIVCEIDSILTKTQNAQNENLEIKQTISVSASEKNYSQVLYERTHQLGINSPE